MWYTRTVYFYRVHCIGGIAVHDLFTEGGCCMYVRIHAHICV